MKKYRVRVNGIPYEVELELVEDDAELPSGLPAAIAGAASVPMSPPAPVFPRASTQLPVAGEPGQIISPLTGAINRILVKEGQSVTRGTVLLEIDAMKMNTKVYAPANAVVVTIHVSEGDNVQQGEILLSMRES
ncbi:biotin/lipoyl-binding protein [candidate division KSB1 bacterium]|nr:MAG: biotin/lipoyl-binding protein [candidate division KSB1 bacterium]